MHSFCGLYLNQYYVENNTFIHSFIIIESSCLTYPGDEAGPLFISVQNILSEVFQFWKMNIASLIVKKKR